MGSNLMARSNDSPDSALDSDSGSATMSISSTDQTLPNKSNAIGENNPGNMSGQELTPWPESTRIPWTYEDADEMIGPQNHLLLERTRNFRTTRNVNAQLPSSANNITEMSIADEGGQQPLKPLWRNLQVQKIPSFDELHDIHIDETPKRDFAPFAPEDEYGRIKPIKEWTHDPSIKPRQDDPFFWHLLHYWKQWGVWATEVKDDARRIELLRFISLGIQEAWVRGCHEGYYNMDFSNIVYPEHMCKAIENLDVHADFLFTKGELAPQAQPPQPKKRLVNLRNKIAPFIYDGKQPEWAIRNGELDEVEITMETIQKEAETTDVANGVKLLSIMQERLDRELLQSDWTSFRGKWKFYNPLSNSRNLFMYGLWEVQECQKKIKNLQQRLDSGCSDFQQRTWQASLSACVARKLQYIALVVLLNAREPIDEEDDFSDNQSSGEINTDSGSETVSDAGKPNAQMLPTSAFPVLNQAASGKIHLTTSRILKEGKDDENSTALTADRVDDHSGPAAAEAEILSPNKRKHCIGSESSPLMSSTFETHEEPSSDYFQPSKRMKLHQDQAPSIAPSMLPQASTPRLGNEIPPLSLSANVPQRHDPSLAPENGSRSSSTSAVPVRQFSYLYYSPEDEAKKIKLLKDLWEPRLNTMLQNAGKPQIHIERWSQVRAALTELGFTEGQRNFYVREYKKEMAARNIKPANAVPTYPNLSGPSYPFPAVTDRQSLVDSPLIIRNQARETIVLPAPKFDLDEYSEKNVHDGGTGFKFRYLPFATRDQRIRLDEIVWDYMQSVMRDQAKMRSRFGRYIVIYDPEDPSGKAIAHGFWDLKRKRQVAGVEWFYDGQPLPHDWDFIAADEHIHSCRRMTPSNPKHATRHPSLLSSGSKNHVMAGEGTQNATSLKLKFGGTGSTAIQSQQTTTNPREVSSCRNDSFRGYTSGEFGLNDTKAFEPRHHGYDGDKDDDANYVPPADHMGIF